jgi:8-oxo-dGTP diphosphatase
VTAPEVHPSIATPRVAAGALFFDRAGRVLLVRPTYKEHWDIPGGYVQPGESPRAGCVREIQEELGLTPSVGGHLVVDWAPAETEGDKLLFIFDAGVLAKEDHEAVSFADGELSASRFVTTEELDQYVPARLSRRIRTAVEAKAAGRAAYAEHGDTHD